MEERLRGQMWLDAALSCNIPWWASARDSGVRWHVGSVLPRWSCPAYDRHIRRKPVSQWCNMFICTLENQSSYCSSPDGSYMTVGTRLTLLNLTLLIIWLHEKKSTDKSSMRVPWILYHLLFLYILYLTLSHQVKCWLLLDLEHINPFIGVPMLQQTRCNFYFFILYPYNYVECQFSPIKHSWRLRVLFYIPMIHYSYYIPTVLVIRRVIGVQ